MAQYMIHLTSEITFEESHPDEITFHSHRHSTLEGHLLITASVNYKLFGYGK